MHWNCATRCINFNEFKLHLLTWKFSIWKKREKKDFVVGAKVDRFEKRAAMTVAVKKHSNENKRKKIIKKYRRAGKN